MKANQIMCHNITRQEMLDIFNDLVPENLTKVTLYSSEQNPVTGEFEPEVFEDEIENQKLFSANIVPENDGSYYVNFKLDTIQETQITDVLTQEIIDKAAAYDILMGRSEGS